MHGSFWSLMPFLIGIPISVVKLPLMQSTRYKLKPALFVAGGSTVLYALAGWL
ncbi:hypothetical protein [Alicyclobacillus mengziensis]|uniref:Uncharacterized protein n=1 Tax=Alicyclobacillus mengziensis TaxID=2931921 RepID=A0A9X7VWM3_9BACL|nr:hypothetical protein [Alicyclobacillus mengziensis]QSO46431.1 hypothetical protein JZ786_18410 [Alicyclobacillus mengziensis]